ncbi:family 43 glycosylhydrolase [Microbacterium betulae]|uniref:Family 43 glycosylhydrolase n=1 Tax=Microbacterium betulae TaxID=2981139 RepID=A0AA97FIH9_9MICO|nr:family 43 glycosylhydrolase [Microbacterium sp. AB]WOF22147.1 family 43 glycosylhydrolase [Microbacterium sp. AB]
MRNPLIPGFHPDPSVCRIGDEYYIATSTFEYLPGIRIFRSRDLENVELAGHVAVRDGQVGAVGVPTGGGVWAPTIRHHGDKVWLVVPDMMGTGRGNVLFTADSPEGPWSDGVVMDVFGIDPDIAWDEDGVCYVTMSGLGVNDDGTIVHLGITQVRFDPETGKALSEPRSIWSGTGGMFPEAPHLYHIGDWWYLLIAEGGTERGHSASIARSASPEGPFEGFEGNPLVTARGTDRAVQNTGHGDLVQRPDGSWAMVLLGTRPRSSTRAFAPLGRETYLTPVAWGEDGWPRVEPVLLGDRRDVVERDYVFPADGPAALDGFDGDVIAVRAFPRDVADLDARPGWARLEGRGAGMEDEHPVFLGVRQVTEASEIEVVLDVSAGRGGISMRYDEDSHLDVDADAESVTMTMTARGLQQSWTRPRAETGSVVRLRIVADPPAVGVVTAGASCDRLRGEVFDEGGWAEIAGVDGAFLSSDFCESFTGRVVGPYARHGVVDVERIRYAGQDILR